MKLNVLLRKMKQKSDADKTGLNKKISELEEKQNNSVSDDSKLNEQITSLNEEVEKYKNDIEKLNREKSDLDNCKTVEIKDLNEKLKMMEEERVREKEILNQLVDSS